MSSIIASREPPPPFLETPTPGTGRGVLSSASIPMDWASRRAGSMVSTTTLRPRSAARRASAADVVVLPTPPEPQHTMMLRSGSSSRASTSRTSLGSWVATSGPMRALARLLWWVVGFAAFISGESFRTQHLGELVEPGQVDAAGQLGQLVRRHVELLDQRALAVLEVASFRVVTTLLEQGLDQHAAGGDAGLLQAGRQLAVVDGVVDQLLPLLGVQVLRSDHVDAHAT